jgi:helicase
MDLSRLMQVYSISKPLKGQKLAIDKGIFQGQNMILVMPTGSGKSILAEWTILKNIDEGGKAVYILPWVAAASQRAANLFKMSEKPRIAARYFFGC